MREKILIATIGYGSGHNMAAAALAEALPLKHPGSEVRMVDFLAYDEGVWDKVNRALYFSAIRFTPGVYHFFYKWLSDKKWVEPLLFHPYLKKMEKVVEGFSPDIIVSTHVFCAMASAKLKARLPSIKTVHGVLTDFMDDAYWNRLRLDRFFVATDELKEMMVKNGVPESSIEVSPFPVRQIFYRKGNREDLCRKIDPELRPDIYTVLVSGGGEGLGRIEDIVGVLKEFPVQCLIVTGRNERLRKRLDGLKQAFPRLFVFGYVNNMHELMDVSDLCITKPGGATVAECLVKGLPLISCRPPLPGPETENMTYLRRRRFAELCPTMDSLRIAVRKRIHDSNPEL
jgi:processive 1,2-diacylglycerol beta-glucosyltransferase